MKIPFTLSLSLLLSLVAHSQVQNDRTHLPTIMPVSPKAFEFQKYTEVPVSRYTGVPSISIPIYTIKASGIEMPLNLSYHSCGVKVNEEAGWVGLGWSLFSGGSITQVVKGFDDFGVYKCRDNEARQIFDACKNPSYEWMSRFDVWITKAAVQPPTLGSHPSLLTFPSDGYIIAGKRDAEPDLFKFNFLNYSGEFILDWASGKFKCITDDDITVEGNDLTGDSFTIKTPDGNNFLFSNIEETIMSGIYTENSNGLGTDLGPLIGQKSSRNYQLTAIYTNGGDQITLNYLPPTALLENLPSISASSNSYVPLTGYPITNTYETFKTVNYSQQSFSYLSSIDFPGGTITFNSSNDRTDFRNTRKLNSIVVKDKSNVAVKTFNFTYDYFLGDAPSNTSDNYLSTTYYTNKTSAELTNRLRLLSIQESGMPPYSFEYNPQKLPKKTSYAFDHWGYYNGRADAALMPDIYGLNTNSVNLSAPFDIVGINRASNNDFAHAGILKKINYPTGGSALFEYELNTFGNFKMQDDAHTAKVDFFLNDQNTNLAPTSRAYIIDVSAQSGLDGEDLSLNTYGNESVPDIGINTYIRLTVIKKTPSTTNLIRNNTSQFWNTYLSTPLGKLGLQVSDVIGDTKIVSLDFIQASQAYETFKLLANYHQDLSAENFYILETHLSDAAGPQSTSSTGGHAGSSGYFHLKMNSPYGSAEVSQGAGLRIKKIVTEDNAGWVSVKDYRYNGGILMGPIRYLRTDSPLDWNGGSLVITNEAVIAGFLQKTTVNSSSFFPPSTSGSGNFVGYNSVSESNSMTDNNGNTVVAANGTLTENYTNEADKTFFQTFAGYAMFVWPSEKNAIQNGLPLSTTYSDKEGHPVKVVDNQYVVAPFDMSKWVYGRVSARAGLLNRPGTSPAPGPQLDPMEVTSVGFYPIFSKKTLLGATKMTEYNNAASVITFVDYQYDGHNQLKQTLTRTSKGDAIRTTYTHPYDYPEDVDLTLMNTYNFITPVIQKTSILNQASSSSLISTSREYYKQKYNFPNGTLQGGLFVKAKTASAAGDAPLEDDVNFDQYGDVTTPSKYKLQQYHGRDDVTTTVLWGYDGQYPVANVIGADFATVQGLVNQAILDNAKNYTDEQIRTELNKIRTGLNSPLVQVVTNTYKPLVGVTSTTDAKGLITYYEYDSSGRLVNVKDNDGNIVSHSDYHYKGQ